MIEINRVRYYRPREIANEKLIVNSRGKAEYDYVLRLVRSGRLKAKKINDADTQTHYGISETEIKKFNDNRLK